MKELFTIEFAKNQGFPVGGGLFIPVVRPDLRISPPYREWTFTGAITRMPEFTAPKLGNAENLVTIDAEIPAIPPPITIALLMNVSSAFIYKSPFSFRSGTGSTKFCANPNVR